MAASNQCIHPDTAEIALGGHSPVSYFEQGQAEMGSSAHAVVHAGRIYHLVSAQQAEAFRKDPERYLPVHDGWCAFGVEKGEKFPVDPENFKIIDGRLHLFLKNDEVDALELWEQMHGQNRATVAAQDEN